MADDRGGADAGLFDKLIPKSRSIEFQFPPEPPNRKMHDDYRASTSTANQTSESFEPTNPRHFINEMRAVESGYTARIGDGAPPSDARKLYRLIADKAVKAMPGSEEHLVISIEAVNTVRCIEQYVRKLFRSSTR